MRRLRRLILYFCSSSVRVFLARDFSPVEVSVKLPFLVVAMFYIIVPVLKLPFLVAEAVPLSMVVEGAQVTPSVKVAVTAAAATSLSTLVEIPLSRRAASNFSMPS